MDAPKPNDQAADELWATLRMMPAAERRAVLQNLIRAGNIVQAMARARKPA